MKNTVICLMGPTASGKTGLAVELVRHLPCDIVSVDSAIVYRDMDVGTAKPTAEQLQLAPHPLIDICDPAEAYSVGRFYDDATLEIETILEAGRVPLLVGGTMLYFHSLQRGLATLPTADAEVRAQLQMDLEVQGAAALHTRLREVDFVAADRIHPNDPQRIQRALEVYLTTGKTLTQCHEEVKQAKLPYQFVNIAVAPAHRSVLHQRIAKRFASMLELGLITEVERLYQRDDLHPELPAMRAVGYRQVWRYLAGELDYDEMQDKAVIATRQLAKRQITWLRGWQDLRWFDGDEPQVIAKIVKMLDNYIMC